MCHLVTHTVINDSQHGFLPKSSCLTNLLEFLEYVTSAVDQGKPVDVIYLNFQKAFDKVPHARLLSKFKEGTWYIWSCFILYKQVVKHNTKTDWSQTGRSCPKTNGLRPHHWSVSL